MENVLQGYSAQSFPTNDFELILIDNNSSDPNIISCYHQYKNRLALTLVYRPVLTNPFALNSARNLGVRISKNNWCIFTDSDCIPSPQYLTEISAEIHKNGRNICMAGIREFILKNDIDTKKIDKTNGYLNTCPRFKSPSNYGLLKDRRIGKIERLPNTEQPWGHFYGCNMVFNKEDIIKAGFFDEHYDGTWGYDDIDLAYRIINNFKVKPIFMKKAIVYHQDKIHLGNRTNYTPNRVEKLNNPNYQYICNKISGYYEFSNREFKRFGLTLT
ncbi:glycosyltransferase [Microbulbifer sp. OS29]|uniref:Glycosyltransferase n=1 Tax=Microbulbifer okhotskensis TaxID=2926617 RepID=A0A9X2EPS3_9GAMM|nr:glycosyltransferase [Microbulbifer okhotskensis]